MKYVFSNVSRVLCLSILSFYTAVGSLGTSMMLYAREGRKPLPLSQQKAIQHKIEAVYQLYFSRDSPLSFWKPAPGVPNDVHFLSRILGDSNNHKFFYRNPYLLDILRQDVEAIQSRVGSARRALEKWRPPTDEKLPLYNQGMSSVSLDHPKHIAPIKRHVRNHLNAMASQLDKISRTDHLSPAEMSWLADGTATISGLLDWIPMSSRPLPSTYAFSKYHMTRFPFGFSVPYLSSDHYLPRSLMAQLSGVLPVSIAEIPDRPINVDGKQENVIRFPCHDRFHFRLQTDRFSEKKYYSGSALSPFQRLSAPYFSRKAVNSRRTKQQSILAWSEELDSYEESVVYELLFELWQENAVKIADTHNELLIYIERLTHVTTDPDTADGRDIELYLRLRKSMGLLDGESDDILLSFIKDRFLPFLKSRLN